SAFRSGGARPRAEVIVDYIHAHPHLHGVEPICRVLSETGTQIAPSTYYAAKQRPPSARSVSDAATTGLIHEVHAENYGVHGVRKVHTQLNRHGHQVARCTVARLMRSARLRGISRAKGPRTTIPGAAPDTRPDQAERHFTAPAPDRVRVADITYCRTFARWAYAAFFFDQRRPPRHPGAPAPRRLPQSDLVEGRVIRPVGHGTCGSRATIPSW
ncbi:MAG: IS3 family transposase, partial [Janthinobacterium lividum]